MGPGSLGQNIKYLSGHRLRHLETLTFALTGASGMEIRKFPRVVPPHLDHEDVGFGGIFSKWFPFVQIWKDSPRKGIGRLTFKCWISGYIWENILVESILVIPKWCGIRQLDLYWKKYGRMKLHFGTFAPISSIHFFFKILFRGFRVLGFRGYEKSLFQIWIKVYLKNFKNLKKKNLKKLGFRISGFGFSRFRASGFGFSGFRTSGFRV